MDRDMKRKIKLWVASLGRSAAYLALREVGFSKSLSEKLVSKKGYPHDLTVVFQRALEGAMNRHE